MGILKTPVHRRLACLAAHFGTCSRWPTAHADRERSGYTRCRRSRVLTRTLQRRGLLRVRQPGERSYTPTDPIRGICRRRDRQPATPTEAHYPQWTIAAMWPGPIMRHDDAPGRGGVECTIRAGHPHSHDTNRPVDGAHKWCDVLRHMGFALLQSVVGFHRSVLDPVASPERRRTATA
jgi:hypothetical protein